MIKIYQCRKLKNIISLFSIQVFFPPYEGCSAKLGFFDGPESGWGCLRSFTGGIRFYQLTFRNCYRRGIWNCCLGCIIVVSNREQSFALFIWTESSSTKLVLALIYRWSAWFYLLVLWCYLYYVFSVHWLLLPWSGSVENYEYYRKDLLSWIDYLPKLHLLR